MAERMYERTYMCHFCKQRSRREDVFPNVGTPHPTKGPWACRRCEHKVLPAMVLPDILKY